MESLMGQSFVAKLQYYHVEYTGYLSLSDADLAGQSGWLDSSFFSVDAVKFEFRFLEEVGDRYHYAITGAKDSGYYAGAALGQSVNGYLGMYHLGAVDNVWKFDFTDSSQKGLFLRDKYGSQVKVDYQPGTNYLHMPGKRTHARFSTAKGEMGRFDLFEITPLP
ncbi:hypothetical protein [Pseudomonas putida]